MGDSDDGCSRLASAVIWGAFRVLEIASDRCEAYMRAETGAYGEPRFKQRGVVLRAAAWGAMEDIEFFESDRCDPWFLALKDFNQDQCDNIADTHRERALALISEVAGLVGG